jgi:2-isopropylmalate synthase
LIKVSKAAVEAGADRISIADTVGAMTPSKMYDLIRRLKSDLDVELNVHCHNDLGLATANALAAYEAGATMIDVSVNGLGERVGISSLSEICLALHCMYNVENNWKLEMLPHISQKVSEFSGMNISHNTPITGENAFLHNAGLHVAAVLNDPQHYEVFPAELVGRKRNFVLDKMASMQTIKQKLEQMNITTCNDNVTKIMHYAKSKEKGTVSDEEIINLLNLDSIERFVYQ